MAAVDDWRIAARFGAKSAWRDPVTIVSVLFLLSIVAANPHGITCEGASGPNQGPQVCEEHLKDEEGFYAWAELYLDGYLALPAWEAVGEFRSSVVFEPTGESEDFDLSVSLTPIGPRGQQGPRPEMVMVDLFDSESSEAIVGAQVLLIGGQGEELLGRTNAAGHWQGEVTRRGQMVVIRADHRGESIDLLSVMTPAGRQIDIGMEISVSAEIVGTGDYSSQDTFLRVPPPEADSGPPPRLELWWDDPDIVDDEWLIDVNGQGGVIDIPANLTYPAPVLVRTQAGDTFAEARFLGDNQIIEISDSNGRMILEPSVDLQREILLTIPDGFDVSEVTLRIEQTGWPMMEFLELEWSEVAPLIDAGTSQWQASLPMVSVDDADAAILVSSMWSNPDGYQVPMASGLTVLDGEVTWVNHWAPGPSIVIALMILLGIEALYGTFVLILLATSLHAVGERMIGRGGGRIAVALTTLTGGTAMLVHGQWMGDLSTVAMLTTGLALALKALDIERGDAQSPHEAIPTWVIGLAAGVALGGAVWMRYSSLVVLPALLLTLIAMERSRSSADSALDAWKEALTSQRTRKVAGPVILGALLLGVGMAAYNAEFYGGPLNSSYQSSQLIAVEDGGNMSAASPDESFLSQYLGHLEWDLDPVTYLGALGLTSLVHLPTIFLPILLIPAIGWRRVRQRLAARPGLGMLSMTWFGAVFAIYGTQLWVLNGTITDIRYYLPLLPPAALLSAGMMVELEDGFQEALPLDKSVGINEYPMAIPLLVLMLGLWQRTRLEVSQFRLPFDGDDFWQPWADRVSFHSSEVLTMKLSVAILLMVAVCVYLQQQRRERLLENSADSNTPFGEVIGNSDGVIAHSNAFSTFDSGEEASLRTNDGEVYTGVKWMCVEFARRFWLVKYGVAFDSVETAADMWAETKSARKTNGEPRGVVPRENGGSTKPRRGDLLIYDRAERDFLGAGHVAVIVEVKEKRIKVAEQNWDNQPWKLERSARYLTLTEEGGAYLITDENPMPDGGEPLGEEVIRGWLRLE